MPHPDDLFGRLVDLTAARQMLVGGVRDLGNLSMALRVSSRIDASASPARAESSAPQ